MQSANHIAFAVGNNCDYDAMAMIIYWLKYLDFHLFKDSPIPLISANKRKGSDAKFISITPLVWFKARAG
jgi:hypothetical protein